jgi:hypothetical protein
MKEVGQKSSKGIFVERMSGSTRTSPFLRASMPDNQIGWRALESPTTGVNCYDAVMLLSYS